MPKPPPTRRATLEREPPPTRVSADVSSRGARDARGADRSFPRYPATGGRGARADRSLQVPPHRRGRPRDGGIEGHGVPGGPRALAEVLPAVSRDRRARSAYLWARGSPSRGSASPSLRAPSRTRTGSTGRRTSSSPTSPRCCTRGVRRTPEADGRCDPPVGEPRSNGSLARQPGGGRGAGAGHRGAAPVLAEIKAAMGL